MSYQYKQANSRDIHEQRVLDAFLKIFDSNGNNPVWAYESLDYMIFIQHKDEFYALNEYDQWQVRDMMIALKKIYQ